MNLRFRTESLDADEYLDAQAFLQSVLGPHAVLYLFPLLLQRRALLGSRVVELYQRIATSDGEVLGVAAPALPGLARLGQEIARELAAFDTARKLVTP